MSLTHWIASAVGFEILEKGENAFDASVATGLVLQVVEPHLDGPAGEFSAIFRLANSDQAQVFCAQTKAPEKASIRHYKD